MEQKILAALSDGLTHSGVLLAAKLGVSREAVSRQVRKLADDGLPVRVIKGRGYRLEYPISLLDKNTITQKLDRQSADLISDLVIHWRVASTNDVCMELMNCANRSASIVCLAEVQEAGKGRRGRKWHSPLASNLYMSIGLRINHGIEALDGFSLAIAVVLARVLSEKYGMSNLALKWPNDLLSSGKKLGGILVEVAGDPAGECVVIIGIGINISMNAAKESIDQPWTDINTEANAIVCRNGLTSYILNALMPVIADYESMRFDRFRDEWKRFDALYGKEVSVCYNNGTFLTGTAIGVTGNGAMMLRMNEGSIREIRSGEVSLRR